MNKSEVCVKLTRKNCKKVLGILEMFGEECPYSAEGQIALQSESASFSFNGSYWCVRRHGLQTYIKPRELRNILAKEHLKVGDVVLIKTIFTEQKIVRINYIDKDRFSFTSIDGSLMGTYDINDLAFIRYATDEEKALLDPKAKFGVDEFEVGVWYVSKCGILANFQENDSNFGWSSYGDWRTAYTGMSDTAWYRKATEAEVIEALTKECVKRYGKDWENVKIKAHAYEKCSSEINLQDGPVIINRNHVWNNNGNLFYNGKWAEPLKEPVTVTKEVWVNVYNDGDSYVYYTKGEAHNNGRYNAQTVKATLTYDIPMTKV